MTNEERAKSFVSAALLRALEIERQHAQLWAESTPYKPRRKAAVNQNDGPEVWYEPNPMRYPIQDGDMLVKGKWFKRKPIAGKLETEVNTTKAA